MKNNLYQNLKSVPEEKDETSFIEEFKELALRYVEIGAKEGVKINAFLPDMPLLMKASAQERKAATDSLKIIVLIHEETLSQGDTALSHKLTWRALRRFSLIPELQIFDRLTEDDIVMIYDHTQTVIFWNLQFFKYFSLAVEQLFFDKWYKLTERDPEMAKIVYEMADNVIKGKITGTFLTGIPGHVVQEVGTIENVRLWLELPWGSTLTKNGSFAGMFLTHRMRVLG